jgi:hypothetical protein
MKAFGSSTAQPGSVSPPPSSETKKPTKVFGATAGARVICPNCEKSVYPNDRQINLDGMTYHHTCAKCADCSCQITLSNFTKSGATLLCKTHYFKRFSEEGSYLGGEKFSQKTAKNAATTSSASPSQAAPVGNSSSNAVDNSVESTTKSTSEMEISSNTEPLVNEVENVSSSTNQDEPASVVDEINNETSDIAAASCSNNGDLVLENSQDVTENVNVETDNSALANEETVGSQEVSPAEGTTEVTNSDSAVSQSTFDEAPTEVVEESV